jgi:BirA family transcriptional regulator, biotin operon repressor / biotin---[acetyl-CoA-carboxylase] ligase
LKIDIGLLESGSIGNTFISDIIYIPEVNSTNDYSKNFKGKDNLLIITDKQVSGKGRYGRNWESEPEKNLTFTIKKNFDIEPDEIQSVNFFFTNFTLSGIKEYLKANQIKIIDNEIELKWPNDILLRKKKLSGFLIESDIMEGIFYIGCGINVNQKKFNKDYSYKTNSLINAFGKEFSREELLIKIIEVMNEKVHMFDNHEFDSIFKFWMQNFNMIGREIVFTDDKNFLGKAKIMDIQRDGGLQILINNVVKTIYSGDIRILYQN